MTFATLPSDKSALLCRMIYSVLERHSDGVTTCGVSNAVVSIEDAQRRKSKYARVDNMLGFDVTVSVVLDALIAMEQRGAVTREERLDVTLWRARRPAQSSRGQVSR